MLDLCGGPVATSPAGLAPKSRVSAKARCLRPVEAPEFESVEQSNHDSHTRRTLKCIASVARLSACDFRRILRFRVIVVQFGRCSTGYRIGKRSRRQTMVTFGT